MSRRKGEDEDEENKTRKTGRERQEDSRIQTGGYRERRRVTWVVREGED